MASRSPRAYFGAGGRFPLTRFRDIDFGEDDANIEYEISRARSTKPVFLQAFFDHPQLGLASLRDGHKYFVLGQKGTGKTAILRKIQSSLEDKGSVTSFIIFRDEVASKEELDKLGSVFAVNVNDVRKIHHHLYTLERLLLLVIASKLPQAAAQVITPANQDNPEVSEEKKTLIGMIMRVFELRWSPCAGQFGGFAKLGSGSHQAASFAISPPPAPIAVYASSGVRPPSDECGRRVL